MINWEQDDNHIITVDHENEETKIESFGTIEYGFSFEGINFGTTHLYKFDIVYSHNSIGPISYTFYRVD